MISSSPKPSQRRLLLGVALWLVAVVIIFPVTDPDFLLALKQTPWTVMLALTAYGGAMYCITWFFACYSRIPPEPEPPWRVALVPIGFVAGAAIGIIYGIIDGDWPVKFGVCLFLGGGLFFCAAVVMRNPTDAFRGACAGVVVAIAQLTYWLAKLWQNGLPVWDARGFAIYFVKCAAIDAIAGAILAVYVLRILRFSRQASARPQDE